MVEKLSDGVLFAPKEYGVIKDAWSQHGDLKDMAVFVKDSLQKRRGLTLQRAKLAASNGSAFYPIEGTVATADQADKAMGIVRLYVESQQNALPDSKDNLDENVAEKMVLEYDALRRDEIVSGEATNPQPA